MVICIIKTLYSSSVHSCHLFLIPSASVRSGASLVTQLVKNPPAIQETPVWFLGREDPWKRDRLPTPVFLDFPCGSAGKESTCNEWDLGSIPGLEISSGEGKGYPLQYSGLENSMGCIVHGVTKSQTRLSNFHLLFLEKSQGTVDLVVISQIAVNKHFFYTWLTLGPTPAPKWL